MMALSCVSKSRVQPRQPLIAAAAAALVLLTGLSLPGGTAAAQQQGIDRSVIPLAPDAPERYVVQKGDTLWDISARFLSDPWYWPEIWYVNPQVENPHLIYPGDELALIWVDGKPRVVLDRPGAARLSPRVREQPLSEAIRAIPWNIVEAFMSRPTVLAKEQVKDAPYVVTGREKRLLSATGDDVYVRRLPSSTPKDASFRLYRVGPELKDPDNGDVLGYDGIYTGLARYTRAGDPATMVLTAAARETTAGDIALPDVLDLNMDFIPRAPEAQVNGKIMAIADERIVGGQYIVVVINRGTRHGLEPGNVLSIWQQAAEVADETARPVSRSVQLPENMIGRFMVFKSWDRLSYGLVLNTDREILVGDSVRNPTP
ncbi:MAG: LysM peptidoglycan-binding domain-containing protein [Steroidobacteraceae bacterium]|jgi:hypothetical protein|nr:LysM peptidoglycan-binding domain-containing protein [Steroidobacteraceae bacterium]